VIDVKLPGQPARLSPGSDRESSSKRLRPATARGRQNARLTELSLHDYRFCAAAAKARWDRREPRRVLHPRLRGRRSAERRKRLGRELGWAKQGVVDLTRRSTPRARWRSRAPPARPSRSRVEPRRDEIEHDVDIPRVDQTTPSAKTLLGHVPHPSARRIGDGGEQVNMNRSSCDGKERQSYDPTSLERVPRPGRGRRKPKQSAASSHPTVGRGVPASQGAGFDPLGWSSAVASSTSATSSTSSERAAGACRSYPRHVHTAASLR